MIELLILLPLLSFLIISFIPKNKITLIKKVSLILSVSIFFYSLIILDSLQFNIYDYKYYIDINYIINIRYIIGIDFISGLLIVLMTLLVPICLLTNWESVKYRFKDFTLILFLLTKKLVLSKFCHLNWPSKFIAIFSPETVPQISAKVTSSTGSITIKSR